MGRGARGQSVGPVPPDPSRFARHEGARLGPHHQHGLDLFDPRRRRPDRLRHHQDGDPRRHPRGGDGDGEDRDYLQRAMPGTLPTPAIEGKIADIAAREGRAIEETTSDYLASGQPTERFVALEARRRDGGLPVQPEPRRTSRVRRCRSTGAGPSHDPYSSHPGELPWLAHRAPCSDCRDDNISPLNRC